MPAQTRHEGKRGAKNARNSPARAKVRQICRHNILCHPGWRGGRFTKTVGPLQPRGQIMDSGRNWPGHRDGGDLQRQQQQALRTQETCIIIALFFRRLDLFAQGTGILATQRDAQRLLGSKPFAIAGIHPRPRNRLNQGKMQIGRPGYCDNQQHRERTLNPVKHMATLEARNHPCQTCTGNY